MPLIDFSIVVQAKQDDAFTFLSDLANIHLWDKTLEVVVPPAGTVAVDQLDTETAIVRDCSGFFHDMGALGGTKGMQMKYSVTGWETPNWLTIGGVPALPTSAHARRISLRFRPGPADPENTTEVSYTAEVDLQGPLEPLSFALGNAARDTAEEVKYGLEQARGRGHGAFRMKKHRKLVPAEGSNEEQRRLLLELRQAQEEAEASLAETTEMAEDTRRKSEERRRVLAAVAAAGPSGGADRQASAPPSPAPPSWAAGSGFFGSEGAWGDGGEMGAGSSGRSSFAGGRAPAGGSRQQWGATDANETGGGSGGSGGAWGEGGSGAAPPPRRAAVGV